MSKHATGEMGQGEDIMGPSDSTAVAIVAEPWPFDKLHRPRSRAVISKRGQHLSNDDDVSFFGQGGGHIVGIVAIIITFIYFY